MSASSPSDPRTPGQRFADEAARRRKQLREEQERHAATRTVLRQTNRQLLRVALLDRLADPRVFDLFVDIDDVTDGAGRVLWSRVDMLSAQMIEARPNLAAPRRGDPAMSPGALIWLTTEEHQGDASSHGALRASRDRPGAGGDESDSQELR